MELSAPTLEPLIESLTLYARNWERSTPLDDLGVNYDTLEELKILVS